MSRIVLESGGSIEHFQVKASARCTVLFHGFPGQKNQNRDLALAISESGFSSAAVFYYAGLTSSKGKFGFVKSFEDAASCLDYLARTAGYESFALIGHSWGGQVALRLLEQKSWKIRQAILLAPLLEFPPAIVAQSIVDSAILEYPKLGESTSRSDLENDVGLLRSTSSPQNIIESISDKSFKLDIFHGRHDQEVSIDQSRRLASSISGISTLYEVNDSHNFENREALIAFVLGKLCQS